MVVKPPFWVGSWVAMAGLSMPGSVLRTKREMAIRAPVFPALTQASASPALTCSMAMRMEEFRRLRRACTGLSSMRMTSLAGTTRMRDDSAGSEPCPPA